MSCLFISGGGDVVTSQVFDQAYINALQWWKNILYIPWAFHPTRYPSCQARIDTIFPQKDWYNVSIISENDTIIVKDLIKYDGLYIWWGNTYRLLSLIRKTWFENVIQEFVKLNKPIYWGSAGAIILWKEIHTAADLNIMKLNIDETLWCNYFNHYSIFCHYKGKEDWEIQEYIKNYKIPVIALPEWVGMYSISEEYRVGWQWFVTIFSLSWWITQYNPWDRVNLI